MPLPNPASLSALSPVNLRDGRLQEVRRVPDAAVRGLQRQQEVRPQGWIDLSRRSLNLFVQFKIINII